MKLNREIVALAGEVAVDFVKEGAAAARAGPGRRRQ
jgi:hypothetical protein